MRVRADLAAMPGLAELLAELGHWGDVGAELDRVVPPLYVSAPPNRELRRRFGITFEVAEVRRLLEFCWANGRHVKGDLAGQRLRPDLWQVLYIVAPVFGWRQADGNRFFREAFVEVPRKNGKALDPSTPVAVPSGWSTMGELRAGDEVFDERGEPCTVVAVADWPARPRFAVRFDDGEVVVADAAHEWPVTVWGHTSTVETSRLAELVAGSGSPGIDVAGPLDTPPVLLPVDPYTLGVWLGDGHTDAGRVTCAEPEVWAGIAEGGWRIGEPPPTHPLTRTVFGLFAYLRQLGVLGAKHIPALYQRASIEQRRALLAGIIDTDGHVTPRGQCEITLMNARLSDDVVELARGLGYKPRMTEADAVLDGRVVGRRYRISFFPAAEDKLARVPRKLNAMRPEPPTRARSRRRHVIEVAPLPPGSTRCIEVDSPSHLFLAGRALVPTHNSTLSSVIALYLLMADSNLRAGRMFEPGAEVYAAATTKDQARHVFTPAEAMVRASRPLYSRLGIRAGECITYERTVSRFDVISGDPAKAEEKMGGNVHGAVIDETHVHKDARLIETIETGTVGRSQPLILHLTTAGADTEGTIYAEKHDLAVAIGEGKVTDLRTWAVIYTIPKSLEERWAEREVWQLANPGLGVSVSVEYLEDAAKKAMRSERKRLAFLRLHLNVRTSTVSRWIDLDLYDRGAQHGATHIGPVGAEVVGRVGYAGLDLSSVLDLSALAVVVPRWVPDPSDPEYEIEVLEVILRCWTPAERVGSRRPKERELFARWAKEGWLRLCPGETIDYDEIELEAFRLADTLELERLSFDRWGSKQILQHLRDGELDVAEVGQGFAGISPAMKETEKLIAEGRLWCGANPLLRYAFESLAVEMDAAGNIKPNRAKSTGHIDPAVAVVMAVDGYARATSEVSAYEERGLTVA